LPRHASLEIVDPVGKKFVFSSRERKRLQNFLGQRSSLRRASDIDRRFEWKLPPSASTEIFDPDYELGCLQPGRHFPRRAWHTRQHFDDGQTEFLVVGGTTVVTNPTEATTPTDLVSAEITTPCDWKFCGSASSLAATRARSTTAFYAAKQQFGVDCGGTSAGNEVGGTAGKCSSFHGHIAATGSPSWRGNMLRARRLSLDGILFWQGFESTGTLSSAEKLYGLDGLKTTRPGLCSRRNLYYYRLRLGTSQAKRLR